MKQQSRSNIIEEGNDELDADLMENGDLEDCEASQVRNILIIGKTGSGKASIANAILSSNVFHVGTAIQSTTRECDDTIKTIEVGQYAYTIALVDTVGVRDDQQHEQIQTRMREALKSFESLSMILLVFKLERFTPQEKVSFQEVVSVLTSRFNNVSAITALIVTCCEQKDDQARNLIRENLAMHDTAKVVQFAQKGTFLVGLPKLSEVPPEIKQIIELKINSDEQQLQDLAKQASMKENIQPESWSSDLLKWCHRCFMYICDQILRPIGQYASQI